MIGRKRALHVAAACAATLIAVFCTPLGSGRTATRTELAAIAPPKHVKVVAALEPTLFRIKTQHGSNTLRLRGIVSPARANCGYDDSLREASRIAKGKTVALSGARATKARGNALLVAYAAVGRNDVGISLLSRGFARVVKDAIEDRKVLRRYLSAESDARSHSRGIWGCMRPRLTLQVSVSPLTAKIGDPLTYTVSVTNPGSVAVPSVSLMLAWDQTTDLRRIGTTISPPPGPESVDCDGALVSPKITCTAGALPAGSYFKAIIEISARAAGSLTATARTASPVGGFSEQSTATQVTILPG